MKGVFFGWNLVVGCWLLVVSEWWFNDGIVVDIVTQIIYGIATIYVV